ncbi:hypothetical protein L6452_03174 [Arctium lappa]|uniref:Uncharacterized protein n=1 Tax=Arctium lappa TaxID=4217 RepID=A0ACB9FMG5_ARCLA|nr:hypothetical protein L6452_03174 [Arctium lappa]
MIGERWWRIREKMKLGHIIDGALSLGGGFAEEDDPVTLEGGASVNLEKKEFAAGERSDLEAGDSKPDDDHTEPTVSGEKYLVIMAGEAKPTFLETVTVSSRTSSFGSCSCRSSSREKLSTSEVEMREKKGKEGSGTSKKHGEPGDPR